MGVKQARRFFLVLCLMGVPWWLPGQTPAAAAGGKPISEAAHISLDGSWKLFYFPQGKYRITNPDQLKTQGLTAIEASVPGETPLDLSRQGVLPADLFFGENIKKLKPFELYEWWYQREFPTPAGIAGRRLELRFHGVDCLATYWLNGKPLGESQDSMIDYRFEVTGKLNATAPNVLTVRLRSPIIEAAGKKYDPAYTVIALDTNQEANWIRRPAHSYGWDIMPRAVSAGLWRPVELVVHAPQEITDMYFTTLEVEGNHAKLVVTYELATELELIPQLRLRLQARCGDSTFTHIHKVQFPVGRMEIEVQNPKLWWPRGYGDANLYKVTTQLLQGDDVVATREDSMGIRKVELIRTEITTMEKPGQFMFKVNGVPILVKGSNWVPADAFHSRDAGRYDKILALFVDLKCNFLRSWGGNVYEDDAFFDICDRNGIMVWQDFAMADAVYPITDDFLDLIRQEAVSVVSKLRNHPSLALWTGDNEVDGAYLFHGLDPAHNKINREVLPEVVFRCDPYRQYLPSSPYISPEVAATGDHRLMPEEHLWGPRDYFKSTYYTEHTAEFVSEAGYHGCPSLSSLKRFIDEQHLWPATNDPQWILHSVDWVGKSYRIQLMSNQVQELFGTVPADIENFILASQVSQAEAMKFLVEMTRLRKWRSTGLVWWNVMDGWPQISDAIVDYFLNKKLAYYYIRRVQEPICVMVDEPKNWHCRVVVGDDSREDASGHYRVWDADSGETLLEGDYAVKANENLEVGQIPVFHSGKRLFLIEWTANGKKYANHYLQGMPPYSLSQYKVWLTKIAALEEGFDPMSIGK
ncbi:MAG: sugar-binding domain-containing protein [Terriglobia bacterium]